MALFGNAALLAQQSSDGSAVGALFVLVIQLAIAVVVLAGMWKMFVKTGRPGWYVLIPFFNLYQLLKIAGKPGWWLILFFIPFVNIVIAIILSIAVAKVFGKGVGFGIGLAFLGFIFYPILGFGDAVYQPENAEPRGFAVQTQPRPM